MKIIEKWKNWDKQRFLVTALIVFYVLFISVTFLFIFGTMTF